jgi:hypothetical protein
MTAPVSCYRLTAAAHVTVLCCHGLFPRPYTRHCRWHIKEHYYGSHPTINPFGIVPVGHTDDLAAPHGREARSY